MGLIPWWDRDERAYQESLRNRVHAWIVSRPAVKARISLPFFYRWPNATGGKLVRLANERFREREPVVHAMLYGNGNK